MKKVIIFALVSVLILSFTACGAKKETPEKESPGTEKIQQPEEEGPPEPAVNAMEYPIKDEVIIDNEFIKLTVSSLKINEYGDLEIDFLCENKSEKKLSVYVKNGSVCGYGIVGLYWNQEVTAGKKINSVMTIRKDDLELANIEVIEEMTLRMGIKDMEETYDDVAEETVSFYPTGLDAGSVVFKDRESVEGERVLVDNEQFKYVIDSVEYDPDNGYVAHMYIQNKTEEYLWLSWEELSVTDFMIYTTWGQEVLPGIRLYTKAIVIEYNKVDELGIDELENFEFVLVARIGTDYFEAPDCFDETLTYEVTA
jgi:hypothetical protein